MILDFFMWYAYAVDTEGGATSQEEIVNSMNRVIAGVALVLLSSTAQAALHTYTANLSGPAEDPPNSSAGTGFTTVGYDDSAHTLTVDVTFSGLTGTTTASHIHCCVVTPGTGTAGIATETPTFSTFPLNVTSGSFLRTYDLTLLPSFNSQFVTANGGTAASAEAALAEGLRLGEAYLNIHTTDKSLGEIRGFLVPEPGTYALLGIGLLFLPFAMRVASSRAKSRRK